MNECNKGRLIHLGVHWPIRVQRRGPLTQKRKVAPVPGAVPEARAVPEAEAGAEAEAEAEAVGSRLGRILMRSACCLPKTRLD